MPELDPVLLSDARTLAAYLIFFGSYFVFALPDPHSGWMALAMASTLAGNLTITGSVANIIVVERAGAEGVHVGFREYLRIGLPVTVATLIWGSAWLWISES
jgi:Na+/H+ antiporter NhaD/arsenite permease-like protein